MIQADVITTLTDLRHLSWTKTRESSGTAGSYLKSYEDIDGEKTYYKLSCYDPVNGITGHESINELIVSRILEILNIPHLSYRLIHAKIRIDKTEMETWLCASSNFKGPGDSKITLEDYYEMEKQDGEDPLSFCKRMGWEKYIYQMILIDYLVLNRDRHGANIEILKNNRTNTIHPAPLFDQGISLVYSCHSDKSLQEFDVLCDLPVQSFVGGRSAYDNLKLIPKEYPLAIRPLEERDRAVIFQELEEALPMNYRNKIWEMIWERWQSYEDFFHK